MNKETALEILHLYKNWNIGNKSVSLCFNGKRTEEDDILDERRKLILEATKTLNKSDEVTP